MLLSSGKSAGVGMATLCMALVLGAGGLWLGFPNDVVQVPPLALLYPVMLAHVGKRAQSAVEALRCGWIVGVVGCSAVLYWLAIPVHMVAGLPWVLALPCALAIGTYVAFYGALFCAGAHILYKKHADTSFGVVRVCVALGSLWCLLEYARAWVFTGFPWMALSAAFAPWPVMIQTVSIVGTYVLSGVYVSVILLFTEGGALYARRSFERRPFEQRGGGLMTSALVMLCLVVGWGWYTLDVMAPPQHGAEHAHARVLMVEGNIDQNQKWELARQESTLRTYMELTEIGMAQTGEGQAPRPSAVPTLVVWPETAMPFYIEQHPRLGRELLRFVGRMNVPFVVGAPGAVRVERADGDKENTGSDVEIFNRAYLITAHEGRGQLESFYDKSQLVPFGEYVPSWLSIGFLEPLLQGIGDFTLGRAQQPLRVENMSLGVLICYEGVFLDLARQRVADGANILLNVSNDGWFGDSSAPEQHLQLSLLRAVEQGRWLIRSTNTGISAVIDAQGRFVVKGGQFREQSVAGFVQVATKKTIFYALQPYLVLVALALFVVSCLFPASRSRSRLLQ